MKGSHQHLDAPNSSQGPSPSDEEIAERAYELWSERGRPEGDATSDWFAARSQLTSERALRVALTDAAPYSTRRYAPR